MMIMTNCVHLILLSLVRFVVRHNYYQHYDLIGLQTYFCNTVSSETKNVQVFLFIKNTSWSRGVLNEQLIPLKTNMTLENPHV